MSREYAFNGPDLPLTWRIRLRLAWRRLRWRTHTDWIYAEGRPGGTVEEAIREVVGQPGWGAEPGVGFHVTVTADKVPSPYAVSMGSEQNVGDSRLQAMTCGTAIGLSAVADKEA